MDKCRNRKAKKPLNKQATAIANKAQPSCSNYAERKKWMNAYITAGGAWECADPANQKPGDVIKKCPFDETAKLETDILKRLDKASWISKDDVAREVVNELSEQELQSLTPSTRIRLLKELRSGYMSKEDKAAQRKIYRNTPLTPQFKEFDKQKRQMLVNDLKNDKIVQDAKQNWNNLTMEERKNVMQHIVNKQAKIYGFEQTPQVELYNKPPENNLISNGYYTNGKIYLNEDPHSKFGGNSFANAVNVLTHENAHHYQNELGQNVENSKIDENDPTYDQAKLFKANYDSYVTPGEAMKEEGKLESYEKQPLEKHSNTVGKFLGSRT